MCFLIVDTIAVHFLFLLEHRRRQEGLLAAVVTHRGPTGHSANKSHEKKSRTTKKVIAAAGLGAALVAGPLVACGSAEAAPATDARGRIRQERNIK
jgi:hypothetical protein